MSPATIKEMPMQAEKIPPMVEVRCTFDRAVDDALQHRLRDSLNAFFRDEHGYVMEVVESVVGWEPGPKTTVSYTSSWASNAQAVEARERADFWSDSNKDRFGWVTCLITFIPERTGI
jgi:hypothetical protein